MCTNGNIAKAKIKASVLTECQEFKKTTFCWQCTYTQKESLVPTFNFLTINCF